MAAGCSNSAGEQPVADIKKHSWASEVEDDLEATGWSTEQAPDNSSALPAYPAGQSKSKKNKKKKKSNKPTVGRTENASLQPPSNNPAPSLSHVQVGLEQISVSDDSIQRSNVYTTTQSYNGDADEDSGWQVSTSRKSRHHPQVSSMPQSNNGYPPSPNSGYTAPLNNRNSYVPSVNNGSYISPSNFNNMPPQNGTRTVSVSGRSGFRPSNDFPPQNSVRPSPQDVRPPNQQLLRPISGPNPWQAHNQAAGFVHGQSQPQRPKNITDVSQNLPESSNRKQWRPQAPQVQIGKIVENPTQTNDNNIMKQFLPLERGPQIETNTRGVSGVGSTNQTTFLPPELNDSSFPADSDSALSDGELDDDSDWIASDGFDSDASVKSLETRKKNKWFVSFFQSLDSFTNEQIVDQDRQWHCPACKGGAGAIDWYRGLQPLIAHSKSHRTKRVGLHREFAKVLEEELEMRRAATGYGETKFGKWKGLQQADSSKMVVWPPMVIIQNTQLEMDEQDKWIGMGNKELLDMFKDHSPMKARHAYGPQGHRGMSVIIFGDSPTGYFNAKRLAKQFKDSLRGRVHWHQRTKGLFNAFGERILYGFIAKAEDMESFNKHSSGKGKLKWELKRYDEAVAQPMKQMDEDNQQLNYYKLKVQIQKEHNKTLEKSVSLFARKLELREQDIAKMREIAKEQYEANQKEMEDLEQTYKQKIRQLHSESARREGEMQEQQEEFKLEAIELYEELEKKFGEEQEQQSQVKEAIARQTNILETSLKDAEDYEKKKRELVRLYYIRKRELYRDFFENDLKVEKDFKSQMDALLETYDRKQKETRKN